MGVDIAVYRARIGLFNHIKVKPRFNLNDGYHESVFSSPSAFLYLTNFLIFIFLPVIVFISAVAVFSFSTVTFIFFLGHQSKKFLHAHSRLSNKYFLFLFSFFSLVVQLLLIISGSVHYQSRSSFGAQQDFFLLLEH